MIENTDDINEEINEDNNDFQNGIKKEEFITTTNNNQINNSEEEAQNKNILNSIENPDQTQDKEIVDEEGNLLDPNDLSFNSEEDKQTSLIFDMEINFIKNISQVDLVFLLDTTKSVNPYLKGIKRYIRKLIFDARKSMSHYLNDDFDILKYALVAYRDHDQEGIEDSYVSKILCDLNDDYNVFRQALYNVKCIGGDDTCEAVVDGLHEAINLVSWREDSIKMIYHICGSPCHGSEFNLRKNAAKKYDKYKDGCPCGMDLKNILKALRGNYIEYNMIAFDEDLKNMAAIFSNFIKVEMIEGNFPPQEGVSGDQGKNEEQ